MAKKMEATMLFRAWGLGSGGLSKERKRKWKLLCELGFRIQGSGV